MTVQVPAPTGCDDFGIVSAAVSQAATLGQAVSFDEGALYRLSQPIIFGVGGATPRGVEGNGAILLGTTPNQTEVVRVQNPQFDRENFFIDDLTIDANSKSYRCLTIHGCQYAFFERIRLLNASSIGFAIEAGKDYGFYYNEVGGFSIRNCQYLGMRWATDLADYAQWGSHIQGNTIRNINAQYNGQNAWFTGVQDSFEGRLEHSKQVGMLIDHSIQFDIQNTYFEDNLLNGSDTALQVDDSSCSNIVRRGGQWDGRVIGTVRIA